MSSLKDSPSSRHFVLKVDYMDLFVRGLPVPPRKRFDRAASWNSLNHSVCPFACFMSHVVVSLCELQVKVKAKEDDEPWLHIAIAPWPGSRHCAWAQVLTTKNLVAISPSFPFVLLLCFCSLVLFQSIRPLNLISYTLNDYWSIFELPAQHWSEPQLSRCWWRFMLMPLNLQPAKRLSWMVEG